MREASLYEAANAGIRLQCNVCQWRCRIGAGHLGRCKARTNIEGKLFALSYGQIASVHADPIEKKPLFHFYPSTRVFSLGTWGCNFRCQHCQNWEISYGEPTGDEGHWLVDGCQTGRSSFLSPEDAVHAALGSGCRGICWTYNEPTTWFEYTLDCAKLAKQNALYTAYVTNGYITPEALDLIGPYLDAFRVDIKGFSSDLYRQLAGIPRWEGILDAAVRAKSKWGMHVEVVTNVIPTLNDDWQLAAIAEWIRDNLGACTPWHVTAFHPDARLLTVSATPPTTISHARQLGYDHGLRFVYTGNVAGAGGEDTRCPGCGEAAIRRFGFHADLTGVGPGGRCSGCGEDLNMRGM